MKAFIIALATLLIITSGVIINGVTIGNICDDLLSAAGDLPLYPCGESGAVLQIEKIFSENEGYLNFGVSHTEVSVIKSLIFEIKTRSEEADYAVAVASFRQRVYELKDAEGFSLGRIV